MNIVEKWMPIEGYEGIYEVSNKGKIKGLGRSWFSGENHAVMMVKPERLLKQSLSVYGYKVVTLCVDGVKAQRKVHRLVADAFIPNPNRKPQVNHKNGDKTDNRIDNLEWVTPKENTIHAHKIGLIHIRTGPNHHRFGKKGSENAKSKKVINIHTGRIYESVGDAANDIGIKRGTLSAKLRGVNRNDTNLRYVS